MRRGRWYQGGRCLPTAYRLQPSNKLSHHSVSYEKAPRFQMEKGGKGDRSMETGVTNRGAPGQIAEETL